MATGAFFNALGYRFYVQQGTTSSTPPSASTGMTEVLSLTNAGIQTKSDTVTVLDYGSPLGFKSSIVIAQTYTIPMSMNLDLTDIGYGTLKDSALSAAAGVTVMWYRESPLMHGATVHESHAGVAFVTDFSEEIQVANVAKVSFTLEGYGPMLWTPSS